MDTSLKTNKEQRQWLWASRCRRYFTRRHRLLTPHVRWRKLADLLRLSQAAKGRLEWIIFWEKNKKDVSFTTRHFGISRKTFYKWLKRFEEDFIRGLEDKSKVPHRRRTRQYTARQYEQVVSLRREYIRYGKMKILEIYRRRHPAAESISAWKIQCIIKASGLYAEPVKQARINRRRSVSRTRKKITELKRKPLSGFLLCLDTIVKYWNGQNDISSRPLIGTPRLPLPGCIPVTARFRPKTFSIGFVTCLTKKSITSKLIMEASSMDTSKQPARS